MKKTYGLALGGGAARGLAHIGVIRYIEENNIPISEVSGTSMGAIIAAGYASGLSSAEMEKFAKSINFLALIDFDLKSGVLAGKKIIKKFEELFGKTKIENTKIPLKIIATDIDSGKKHVFEKGNIVDALRASMSLPSILRPYEIGKKKFVDGGISSNLPVEVLQEKNIIAVSGLKDFSNALQTKKRFLNFEIHKSFLTVNYQIFQKTLLIMMSQNERASIQTPGKKVTLVEPDFGNLDYYSFNKVDQLVKIGYEAMEKASL